MDGYQRNHETVRKIFTSLEVIGSVVVVVGVIVIVSSILMVGILSAMGFAGIFLSVFGLLCVAQVQSSRANVDTAKMTLELLKIAKQDSEK